MLLKKAHAKARRHKDLIINLLLEMLTITYSANTTIALRLEVEERLQNLALAYRKEEKEQLEAEIILQDGQEYVGKEAVINKLEDLEQEMKSWWYCAC